MTSFFAASDGGGLHVSLPAEPLYMIGDFPITNSWVTGILGTGLMLWMFFYVAGKVKREDKNRFVSLVQWVFEGLFRTVEQVIGDKVLARKLAPLVITMFFFILINYWMGILPGVGPLTINEIPILRSLIADLNTTFALSIITMVMAQVYAIRFHGAVGNLKRYFRNPFKDPVGSMEGALELIADFSRLVSLSLRLFGNVFAGEVLLIMVAVLTLYVSPITLPPFYIFELFIGAVQAYIFFMLTTVFIALGLISHGHDNHQDEPDHSTSQPKLKTATAAGGNDQ